MVILTLTEKGGEPRQLTFDKNEVTIGRVQGNDVVLPKGNVSKRHCRIYVQDGHFSVEDLKSTNGTYVNGRKITESTVVSTADKVYVGDFVVRVDSATPAEIPTPPPPGGNEAGSLSSALPRRPPPPPPPRPSSSVRPLEEEPREAPARARSSSRITLPPPPPPPRRDSNRAQAALLDDDDLPPLAPPAPADIDLDEESLEPPRLNVPPLKPVISVSDDDEREAPPASRDRIHAAPPSSADYPGWLRRQLDRDGVSGVYVTGSHVEVEIHGRREAASISGGEAGGLIDALRALASRGTPRASGDASVVNVTLSDGGRLVAVFPPVAEQVCAAIQRPTGVQRGLTDLVSEGALSREMQQVLEACSGTRRNVLVTGDRRAAELVLQALASTIASRFRVVAIADRVVPPAPGAWIKLAAEPHRSDLLAAAVALRPDYLIVDVSAAPAAAELLHECAVGQEGVFAVVAGRSPNDALARLQGLAASAVSGGAGIRELIVGSLDLVVHAASAADGSVRVLEIAEPRLDPEGRLSAEPLLVFRAEDGRAGGRYQTTGSPSRLAATLAARGVQIPAAVLPR